MLPTARFANLDKLRGFAAISVVLYHVIEHTHWTSYPVDGLFYWGRIGWMGVNLFFVISGFVITYSAWHLYVTENARWQAHYWRRRLTRIVPLYLLTMAVYMTVITPEWLSVSIAKFVWQSGAHLLFIHNVFPGTHGSINGVNWSIGVEMQFYLLMALVLPWVIRATAFKLLATFIGIAWGWKALTFWLLSDHGTPLLFQYTTQLPGTLDEFVLGILLCKIMLDPKYSNIAEWLARHFIVIAAGSFLIAYVMLCIYREHAFYWDNGWMVVFFRTLIGITALAAILTATFWPWKAPRILSQPIDFLGKISYGLYLWHLPVILSLKRSGVPAGLPFLVKTLLATIVLATLSYYLFEKLWMRDARLHAQEPTAPYPSA
jgi:peptidoglycan/LPS O-acetylase OafA/YrhL